MHKQIANSLLEKVKKDYSKIAKGFSDTRKYPWGEFEFFAPYLNENDHLLDLGCGNGRLSAFLEDKKIRYVGIDNNEEFLKLARTLHPKAEFILGDQTKIPLEKNSMDHIWNIAAFHHIPSKKLRIKALNEMKRVLKPNGFLILTVWNLWQKQYRKYIYRSIFKNLIFGEYEYNDTFIPWGKEELIERYYHAFRIGELKNLLEDSGFKIVDKFCTKHSQKVSSGKSYNFCFICKKS